MDDETVQKNDAVSSEPPSAQNAVSTIQQNFGTDDVSTSSLILMKLHEHCNTKLQNIHD